MSSLDKAVQTQVDNIQKKTGKSLDELAAIVKKSGLTKHGEIRDMLKEKLGLGHGDANTLVEVVTSEEWEEYKHKLHEAYLRMDKLFRENPRWDEDTIGGALSIVVHTAYHLGEIRQALCTLK